MKFDSGRLKAQNYDIKTTFEESRNLGEIVALGDSQVLRSIRDIRNRTICHENLERLIRERQALWKRLNGRKKPKYNVRTEYEARIEQIRKRIDRTVFIEDYVTVKMETGSHYDHIFNNGFYINGKKFMRLSCSAGQARVSTVVFCAEDILQELEHRLNNGRDMTRKQAPSKFNAYYGLYTSATRKVSEPRFAVVRDFENTSTFMANFATETDWDADDEISVRKVTVPMNRTDGMGLISPELSARWATELEMDHVPSQWIVRQSFLKGMVCTFDFRAFCEEVNGGNYLIDTIYTDAEGKPVKADLHEVDMIVSESQFKLWDSFESMEQYVENTHKNKLYWGITGCSPKEPKDVLRLNYQFIQTLDLKQADIEELCAGFVDWIERVSYKDPTYMLLFLLGKDVDQKSMIRILSSPDKAWIRALFVNRNCANDSYIRGKIRELVHSRIENGRMGEVLVNGNFQMLVSDPYAYMQHICGLPVTGLLKKGEYYCNYWNKRGVGIVDSMRSPMTHRSEHVIAKLVKNELTEKWYRHCGVGFMISWFGNDCVRYSGADFDGDIIATTDSAAMIRCVYKDELPVVYDAPKPVKKLFTKKDLYASDKFGFGSKIGAITNKGTIGYALLPLLEKRYGKDSEQVALVESRIKQCCVAQSKQIDRTKIGQAVKSIPKVWINRQKRLDNDTHDICKHKELLNACLLNRRPYFFKYRYREDRQKHRDYYARKNSVCLSKFGMSVAQLREKQDRTPEQNAWLWEYFDYSPLIESDSPMNLLCRYLEEVNFKVAAKVKTSEHFTPFEYMSDGQEWEDYYNDVVKCYERHKKDTRSVFSSGDNSEAYPKKKERLMLSLKQQFRFICPVDRIVADALVFYCYVQHPSVSKDALWSLYGKILCKNAVKKAISRGEMFVWPEECAYGEGDTIYLGKSYKLEEVDMLYVDEYGALSAEGACEEDIL